MNKNKESCYQIRSYNNPVINVFVFLKLLLFTVFIK